MQPSRLLEFQQKKQWTYEPSKNYDSYVGMKAYLCTKWDNTNKINLKNYGKIDQITELYVCLHTGYIKGYIELSRRVYYTHSEIKHLFLKTHNDISIKKLYHHIKTEYEHDKVSQNNQQIKLLKDHFRTI